MAFNIPSTWVNRKINVALIGVGGTGSHCLAKLALLHRTLSALHREQRQLCRIGRVDVFDPKEVNHFALARGLFTSAEVGTNKAIALCSRYNMFLGECIFHAHDYCFDKKETGKYDLIITCLDQAKPRVEIGSYNTVREDIVWLDCGVDGNTFSVILGLLGFFCGKLPNAIDLTDLDQVDDAKNRKPSCSVMDSVQRQAPLVNDNNAGFAISLLSQLLIDGTIKVSGCTTDLDTLNSSPIEISHESFLMYGYENYAPKPVDVA